MELRIKYKTILIFGFGIGFGLWIPLLLNLLSWHIQKVRYKMSSIEFKINDYQSMSDADFKKIISKLSDLELSNRIKQANNKSNVYKMLIEEASKRVIETYHNEGMH